jgi:AcrR family transcriptional regulator
MSPEERREMIVQAAVPLVTEYGAAVTTSQIARAAGIAEGTIFRVFADKDEVLAACFAEVLRPDRVEAEIAAISLDQPLADRLAEAADALHAHFGRLGALFGAVQRSGYNPPRSGGEGAPREGCENSQPMQWNALADLFEPEREQLRLPAAQLASAFVALLMQCGRHPDDPSIPDTAEAIQLLLHGAFLH